MKTMPDHNVPGSLNCTFMKSSDDIFAQKTGVGRTTSVNRAPLFRMWLWWQVCREVFTSLVTIAKPKTLLIGTKNISIVL
jgi:hypothetical protein